MRKSLKVVDQLKKAGKEAHLKAKRTKSAYEGHIRRGCEWLAGYYLTTDTDIDPDLEDDAFPTPKHSSEDDPYTDPAFRDAFCRTPNKCSDKALALFMTYKGFHEDLGQSTVEAIQSAFKDMWEKCDGDTYCGKWHFDVVKQRWEGNPAKSAEVDDVLKSLRHKANSEDGDRSHALPMSKDHVERMLLWSKNECPSIQIILEGLRQISQGDSASFAGLKMDLEERKLVTHHLEQIAFDTTAWTLWTRCFELVKLNRKEITIDPVLVNRVDQLTNFNIFLKNRKGWQQKVNKGLTESDMRSNHYQIYPRRDLPGSDAFLWLLVWIKWLEIAHYGRELDPDNCVFPAMGANGVVQPHEQLSHDTVQKWISEATKGAGIPGTFSTHCFRCGGAQYWFMFAPVRQRWPLAKVRWWGGWAEGENRNTLIRYLLDELYCYENDHSDSMGPISHEADQSLAGEAALVRPISAEELREVHVSVTSDVQGLRADMDSVTETPVPLTIKIPTSPIAPSTPTCTQGSLVPTTTSVPTQASASPHVVQPTSTTGRSSQQTNLKMPLLPITNHGQAPSLSHTKTGCGPPTHGVPMAGLLIPDVPVQNSDGTRHSKEESWRDIIKHWLASDPARGLHTPLKDWPPEWIQGKNRVFAVKYHQRSVIALEFINTFDSNEGRFLAAYPESEHGHTKLLTAINNARWECGDAVTRKPRK
ncbi:hypothetical protein BU15DRAFT_41214 [Melanogaster broomeanus]|nr:hypothetical protein BU15DRAFT_41214 [Melanogaster broomeanus]